MKETYTLYGSYASYYTAKVRSYLRKKAIPFVERLPSDPTFREPGPASLGQSSDSAIADADGRGLCRIVLRLSIS